jgi:hypothetical protein
VKVAFVVGFFNSLETPLRAEFQHELDGGRLVFLGIPSPRYSFSFAQFKSKLFGTLSQTDQDPVYIFAADMRNSELAWVRGSIEGIVNSALSRENCRPIQLAFFENAQDFEAVADALRDCQLSGAVENHHVDESALRAHMNGHKGLCVRGRQQSSFEDALRRANIQFENFTDYFEELDLPYGPNVGKTLKDCAKRYRCLLYAWGELKYLEPNAKDRWHALHQGKTPAAVVARFKEAVLHREDEKIPGRGNPLQGSSE